MTYLLKQLVTKYRNIKKQDFLMRPATYKKKYAIIGTGQHNLSNLYPCIWHLGICVKIICSANKSNAAHAALRWPDCIGTDNINDILSDNTIDAVIVCVPGSIQAGITKKLLKAGKHVFVEKPIGYSINELKDVIAIQNNTICQPGLQRRFSKILQILKKEALKEAISYNYRFLIGAYPEGNLFYDIFIHPIDFVITLFGIGTVEYMTAIQNNTTSTYFLILNHKGIKGTIELSSNYSWQQPVDEIIINTKKQIITARYPYHVTGISKSNTLLNIPLDKIMRSTLKKNIYLEADSLISTEELNSLNLLGFYPELKSFIENVEKSKLGEMITLQSLLPTYEILELLEKN